MNGACPSFCRIKEELCVWEYGYELMKEKTALN